MCMSAPKIPDTKSPPPQYLHNPLLDGESTSGGGFTSGRNSMRIDLTAQSGQGLGIPQRSGPQPRGTPLPASAPNPAPFSGAPGVVIPTIGGSLAGAVPPSVAVSGLSIK